MATFRREETMAATPSQVFAALTDLEQASAIMPDIVKIELLGDATFGQGTRWKETRRFKLFGFLPMRASATLEVTEFQRNKRYTTVADDGCNWASYTFTTTSAGRGRTKVVLDAEFKLIGRHGEKPKAEQRAAKMAEWCEKADGDLLQRLKRHMEGTTTSE